MKPVPPGLSGLRLKGLLMILSIFFVLSVAVMILAAVVISMMRSERRTLQRSFEENKRLAIALDSASDGVLLTDPNLPDNPIVYANASFTNITGYAVSEVIGKNCRFLRGPDTDPLAVERIREAIRARRPLKVSILNYRRDGSTFWNGLRLSPVLTKEGKLQYFLGFQADITERMEAEQQLFSERDYTRAIINGSSAIISGVKADGTTDFLNPAGEKTTGYDAAEIVGHNWWNLLYPGEEYRQAQKFFQDLKKGGVHDYEMILTTKSGEKRTVLWNCMDRLDAKGDIVESIHFGHDITERKKLETQVLQTQKMETLGSLAGGIAHDLNNQMTPLTGYLDLVLKDMPVSDPSRAMLAEAEQAARRCTEVIQRLMSISKTSNQKKLWMKLDGLLAEIKRSFPKVVPAAIDTEVVCDDPIWPVLLNDTEIQTVLMALVNNSCEAMPDGGKLSIRARNMPLDDKKIHHGFKAGHYVLITVADTGKGISPQVLPRIFEPFFTTKPKGSGGKGLGLSMVFRTIKDHGGWVEAQSEVGKGSVMQIYLPADQEAKPASHGAGGTGRNIPRGNGETILFVDDEESLRNLGSMFLDRLGYKTILAEDGAKAVACYKNRHKEIAAVVMDMTMPNLNGRQALKKILEINPKAKVLLASGFTEQGTAKELIQEGAFDFLPKPYTILPLAQILKKVLSS